MSEHFSLAGRIERDFTFQKPTDEMIARFTRIREAAKALAMLIEQTTPACREQSLAITELEQVVFWATASIVRNP